MSDFVLAIDQGTTSTRAILFDSAFRPVAVGQRALPQIYPRAGWVEHDPEEIWAGVVASAHEALARAGVTTRDIAAIGIANQRETVVLWDRRTGKSVHNAIVWQDRRTAAQCHALQEAGQEDDIRARTGLLLDPYFSATKIAWLLDNIDGARDAAASGRLAYGTIDSFLLWRLTGGQAHATDATNASRTLLYDIAEGGWSPALLDLFGIPAAGLPEVRDSAAAFGTTDPALFGGAIPVTGIAGDQQAATVGQACFTPGMVKSTYGTGCFAVLNTGPAAVRSTHRLLTTIAYQLDGVPIYALEGSIFVAGAAVQWLRDELGLLKEAADSAALAEAADPTQDVVLVPAFVGLGAPHWDPDARGALYGLTRGTGPKELARAVLESVCYQTRDLLEAMRADWHGGGETVLRVDGGMAENDWTLQRLADLIGAPVDRPSVLETTALGAAYLAGFQAGLYPPPDAFAEAWTRERRFDSDMDEAERERKYALWRDAVRRTLSR